MWPAVPTWGNPSSTNSMMMSLGVLMRCLRALAGLWALMAMPSRKAGDPSGLYNPLDPRLISAEKNKPKAHIENFLHCSTPNTCEFIAIQLRCSTEARDTPLASHSATGVANDEYIIPIAAQVTPLTDSLTRQSEHNLSSSYSHDHFRFPCH
jgi:hypothetical protein